MKNLEGATRSNYSGHTMTGLEQGLGWEPRTVGRILNNDVPDWAALTSGRAGGTDARGELNAGTPMAAASMSGTTGHTEPAASDVSAAAAMVARLHDRERTEAEDAVHRAAARWLAELLDARTSA